MVSNLQAIGSSWYGNVWLALATIAYTDDASAQIAQVTTDLPLRIAALAPLPGPAPGAAPVAGQWVTDWGPVYSNENANLMYAVSYRANGVPLFAAISIRGTDTSEMYTPLGLCTQLAQDFDVKQMVAWQQILDGTTNGCTPTFSANPPPSQAAIAHGSCEGLSDLLAMTATLSQPLPNAPSGPIGIQAYVEFLANAYAGLPIVVTGHSLGGCQTTVLALYLAQMCGKAVIVPHPFAPPSAGNSAWNTLYANAFTNGQIWWNTADVAPNAFQNVEGAPTTTSSLSHILQMWTDYGDGPAISGTDANAVADFQKVGGTYQHLVNSMPPANVQTLNGTYMTPQADGPGKTCTDDWLTQLMLQHFPPMYAYLIKNQRSIPAFEIPPPPGPFAASCTVPEGRGFQAAKRLSV